jgi:hypothetical protein
MTVVDETGVVQEVMSCSVFVTGIGEQVGQHVRVANVSIAAMDAVGSHPQNSTVVVTVLLGA